MSVRVQDGGLGLAEKKAKKDSKAPEKPEHGPDFKYIVRIANTDINGERRLLDGITTIKGIHYRLAKVLADDLGVPHDRLMGDLTDQEVDRLVSLIDDIPTKFPHWMLNRQRDMETGEDTHAISQDLDILHKDDINFLRKIKCYKGVRHELGQKVRGQRSKSNGRTGSTVGVVRKKLVP